MIAIVDYGMGNLRSVAKALERVGASVRVTDEPAVVAQAAKVVLPGVGAFPAAMQELAARKLIEPVTAAIAAGRPYLGICLGLQLLFERGEEGGGALGLGILQGAVKRFSFPSSLVPRPSSLKIPHMGWNQVMSNQQSAISHQQCPLLRGIPEGSFFYFVHSYYAEPADPSVVALASEYGTRFPAMVCRGNLFATQFHPEKSQAVGLQLLKNFIEL